MGSRQRTADAPPRIIETPCAVSALALRACSAFGAIPRRSDRPRHDPRPPLDLLGAIGSRRVVLVTGASGSGKSTILRRLADDGASAGRVTRIVAAGPAPGSAPGSAPIAIIDQLPGSLRSRVSTLSMAGLAQPALWAMPQSRVSAGERARAELARAVHGARPGDLVIADEFCSLLDRTTAYAVAKTMRRLAIGRGLTLVAATAHEDMESMLTPQLVIDADAGVTRPGKDFPPQQVRIEPGAMGDYDALGHLHYRTGRPATGTLVLRAVRHTPHLGPILAGVLVVSRPVLNAAWRDRAWPGVFSSPDKKRNARALNDHLRCISRVVVEPRSRGLGIASALVRAYLGSPQTIATEALATMGSISPFFERAGMTPYVMLPAPRDLRLLDALTQSRRSAPDLLRRPIEPRSLIRRELIAWARSRKLIRTNNPDPHTLEHLALTGACRLMNRPRAYAHTHRGRPDGDQPESG